MVIKNIDICRLIKEALKQYLICIQRIISNLTSSEDHITPVLQLSSILFNMPLPLGRIAWDAEPNIWGLSYTGQFLLLLDAQKLVVC